MEKKYRFDRTCFVMVVVLHLVPQYRCNYRTRKDFTVPTVLVSYRAIVYTK